MRASWLAVAGAVAVLTLAGCSGDGDKEPDKGGASSKPVISPEDMPEIPTLKQAKGIIADTTTDECSTKPGKVSANGTVKNSADEARDLAVTNTGTTRLTDVGVDDPMLSGVGIDVSCPRDALRPGQSMVCESEAYAITGADVDAGGVRNVATATAHTPGGGDVTSDESTVTVSTEDGHSNGWLPNTGAGFTWWMPLAGLALLGVGFWLIVARPRNGERRKV